jgi:pectin methylesterase-like acyl-CoA thioesterase
VCVGKSLQQLISSLALSYGIDIQQSQLFVPIDADTSDATALRASVRPILQNFQRARVHVIILFCQEPELAPIMEEAIEAGRI